VITSGLLVALLHKEEQSLPNMVTILGTVVTFGASVFTIREQLRLKTLTRAISDHTKLIENDITTRLLDWNVEKGIHCIEKLISCSQDTRLIRLYDKLNDLMEYLMICKKQTAVHSGRITGECLEALLACRHQNVPKSFIVHEIARFKAQCAGNRQAETDLYIELISSFMLQIVTGNYTRKTMDNLPHFIATINQIKHYFF
jgi:hypothetical protein